MDENGIITIYGINFEEWEIGDWYIVNDTREDTTKYACLAEINPTCLTLKTFEILDGHNSIYDTNIYVSANNIKMDVIVLKKLIGGS